MRAAIISRFVFCLATAAGSVACFDPDKVAAPDEVLTLTASPDTIPANGFSTSQITAHINPASRSTLRVSFTTSVDGLTIPNATNRGADSNGDVVVLLTSGEEFGVLGTQWYLERPAVWLDSTVADLQVEMVGRPDTLVGAGKLWLTGFERSTMGEELSGAGLPVVADPRPEFKFFERSDNIVFALRGVYRNAPLYRWYLACLALMALRCSYLAGGDMPGAPEYWRAASDSSVVLLVCAIYRLLTTLWQIREPRHHEAALLLTAALQVAALWSGWTLALPAANLLLWISVCAGAGWMIARIATRASHVPAVEKHLLHWAMLFAVVSGMLEAATYRLDPAWRLIWLYPVGTATLALAFGFLLTRRALLGGRLLAHARQSLGRDLDLTLLACADRADAVWDSLSTRVASQERERVLLDIGAGFGARMARIAQELRRLQPQSRLPLDIHRALLDLRLMIDATDLDLTSADDAFVLLRRHLDPALAAAGISAHWDLSALRELRLGDRRRLMELFRCLEELLSNVMQHSAARQVAVTCGFAGGWLRVAVTDNGRGLPEGATQGRGLANVAARLRALDGEAAFSTPPLHPGTQVEIAVPWR